MKRMSIEDEKEVIELIKAIQDINMQIANPNRSEIIEILKKAQQKFILESAMYENTIAVKSNSKLTKIDDIDTNTLYTKLPYYKSLYEGSLIKKCTDEEYSSFKSKYNF